MPTNTSDTCPECGVSYSIIGCRTYSLLNHMINAGEISVGEARKELHENVLLTMAEKELLASWVLDRADQGDEWRAGDPVTLPCGCRVSYDGEQLDTQCDGTARFGCQLDRRFLHVPGCHGGDHVQIGCVI